MVEEVLRGMNARRAILSMPQPLIRLVARSAETVRVPFPVATDQLRQLSFDNITALDSVRASFGFDPRPMDGSLGYLRRKLRDQEPGEAFATPAP